jgi:hypothetical protein
MGPCPFEHASVLAVAQTAAQVVQMRHRDLRQSRILLFAELLALPLQDTLGRWAAQAFVRAVHSSHQHHVFFPVLGGKSAPSMRLHFHRPAVQVCSYQSCQLCGAPSCYFLQIRPHPAPLFLLHPRELLHHQNLLCPGVHLRAPLTDKIDLFARLQKLLDLSLA